MLLSAESTVYSGDWSDRENQNGPVFQARARVRRPLLTATTMYGRSPDKTPARCTVSPAAATVIFLLRQLVLGAYAGLTSGSDHFHFRRADKARSFMGSGCTVRDRNRRLDRLPFGGSPAK